MTENALNPQPVAGDPQNASSHEEPQGIKAGRFPIYRDSELQANVELLNQIYPSDDPWQSVVAHKDHDDLFGDSIKPGELYYNRVCRCPWNPIKLSRRSMEAVVFCVVEGNQPLLRVLQGWQEQRFEKLRALVPRIIF